MPRSSARRTSRTESSTLAPYDWPSRLWPPQPRPTTLTSSPVRPKTTVSTRGPGQRGARVERRELAQRRGRVVGLHQQLADEDARRSHCSPCAPRRPADRIALSAIAIDSGGTSAARRSPTPRSSSKVPRSRAFTPTICAPMLRARSSSDWSWVSTSTARPSPRASSWRSARTTSSGMRGDDQQDRVGTDRTGLEHLDLVDHEVLAEHRELARPSRAGGSRRPSRRNRGRR